MCKRVGVQPHCTGECQASPHSPAQLTENDWQYQGLASVRSTGVSTDTAAVEDDSAPSTRVEEACGPGPGTFWCIRRRVLVCSW